MKVTLTPTRIEPVPAILNNSESRLEDGEISPDDKKVSPSSKRGKSQRSRRMIRQKRRSTGVVNKEDLEELDQINSVCWMLNLISCTLVLVIKVHLAYSK